MYPMKVYVPLNLDEDTLAHMRAPPENVHFDDDSSSDSDEDREKGAHPPGAFPGASATGSNDIEYY